MAFSGTAISSTNFAALHALPEQTVRMGSGLFSLVRGVASSFGVAMGATLLERQVQVHTMQFSEDAGAAGESLADTLGRLQRQVASLGDTIPTQRQQSLAMLWQYLREEAVFGAYRDLFLLGGVLSVLTLIPVFFLRSRPRQTASSTPAVPKKALR